MSFEPPDGILDIGNATLRVGKLEVAETSGLNQGLLNIVKNNLLITSNTEYASSNTWGIKLPTTWVADFDVKGHSEKYVEFNFYNEDKTSNALGYLLNFKDTTLSLMYDTSLSEDQNILATATIPTIVGAFRKVNIFFERGVISVSIDGTRYLYFKESDGYNQGLGVASRVVSTTGSAFVNVFIEQDADDSAFKNLRIVNGRFISDKTSNIAFIGGNLGVGVNSPQETLDIRGNMHFNRVSNVSSVSVDSNVVTEYTGPHDRPLRKYPEVALTSASQGGYVASTNNKTPGTSGVPYRDAFMAYDGGFTTMNVMWQTLINSYDSNGDDVSGDTFTAGSISYVGHWNKLQLPNPIKVDKIEIIALQSTAVPANDQRPDQGAFLGSIDGTNWELIYSFSSGTLGWSEAGDASAIRKITTITDITNTNKYNYLVLVVEKIPSTSTAAQLGVAELRYYGHEEGSGSLDTTLKTVYNVPATTGTQLDVYYDGQDYGPSVPTSITDKTGNGNNTTTVGSGIGFDSTYKAFTFDGTSNGKIVGTHDFTGDASPVLTMSFWMKRTAVVGSYDYIATIGTAATGQMIGLTTNPSNQFNFGNQGDGVITDESILLNQWYHVTLVANGGAALNSTNFKPYINGKEPEIYSYGGDSTTNLTGSQVTLGTNSSGGQPFNGSIANFRLYSKALNADQIKELYDYQKDYFLGSKSQVTLYKGHLGVGVTEPSGQLELAGDERIQEYPPGPMSGYKTHIPGHGEFQAYASTDYGITPYRSWNAFDKSITTVGGDNGWATIVNSWLNDGTTTPISSLAANFDGVECHWLALQLPYEVKPTLVTLQARDGSAVPGEVPTKGRIYGSKDGVTWNQIRSYNILTEVGTLQADTVNKPILISLTTNEYYTHLLLTVDERYGGSGSATWTDIGELRYFGTPGPTTLDKGSLTLGRSLDVPRISRYDVDTETPRPEKLVLDYDTTVKNDGRAVDISGSGNDGFYYGHANYSAPDKAFKFDGTGDTVYVDTNGNISDTNLPTGDAIYTISCWVKTATTQTVTHPCILYFGSSWTTSELAGVYLRDGNKLAHDIGSSGVYTTNQVITVGQWHHIVVVKRGTGDIGANTTYQGLFVDGVEITQLTINGSPRTQTLGAIDNISIGSSFYGAPGSFSVGLNGCISKPQIWNVALEASEVRKLYRLGRTGRSMVISDTAVGIGKVPEAHLDVRGSLNVTGNFNGNSPLKFYRFRLHLPLNTTGTSYIRRSDGAAGFPSDYDDTKIISISSVTYNQNGDVIMGQGDDTSWKNTIYSIPLHSGSSNAGLVIYYKGAGVQSNNDGDRRLEVLVITY